jgi:D-glycero-alpha-D-manno-heptose 1-phosphate guanylyltransferase
MEVIILAGGKGTRLRSIIGENPKPMALVNGRPFLEIQLEWLLQQKVTHFIISVGYQYEKIIEYFGDSYKNIAITYIIEQSPMGTGGAIALASGACSSELFFVINGDSYYPILLEDMLSSYSGEDLMLATKYMKVADRYGVVQIKSNQVTGFQEKNKNSQGLINAGIYCMRKEFASSLPRNEFSFEEYLQENINSIDFTFYEPENKNILFIDIGVPEDYERAQKIID